MRAGRRKKTGPGRGGYREGAGRKPGGLGRRNKPRQITAPPELWARIDAAAAADHLDVSAWMRLAAERLLSTTEQD